MQKTFEINEEKGYILCLVCKRKSYNTNDIREKYCGYCHRFHEDPPFPEIPEDIKKELSLLDYVKGKMQEALGIPQNRIKNK